MDHRGGIWRALWRFQGRYCDGFTMARVAWIHRQRRALQSDDDQLFGDCRPGARGAAHGNPHSGGRGKTPLRQHERSADSRRFAAGGDRSGVANNFMPHSLFVPKADNSGESSRTALSPAGDLATIYNLNPAFAPDIRAAGRPSSDRRIRTFTAARAIGRRSGNTFGLDQYTGGSLTQVHPAAGGGWNLSRPERNQRRGNPRRP